MGRRFVEWLERRLFLSATDPSAFEQQTLELINRMRQNPAAELPLLENSTDPGVIEGLSFFHVNRTTLGSQWATLVPVPPLAWNDILAGTALAHDVLMKAANSQSHQLPGEPDLPTRANAAGYNFEFIGESIFIAGTSVFDAQAAFAIDWGNNPPSGIQDPPGHRDNIMDSRFTEMGIAVLSGPGNGDGTIAGPLVFAEDFGSQQVNDGPFLLGSVFSDTDGDGFYTAGEGIGGVTVQAVGGGKTFTTTSLTAGGYQMALPAGSYTVTFSGGSLTSPSVFSNVVVGANNVQLDLDTGRPKFTSAATATFIAGQDQTFTITTMGLPPVTLALKSGTLPSGLSFTDNGDGTASLAGTAALGTGGTYTLTLTASNSLSVESPIPQSFKLIVDQAPAFTSADHGAFKIGSIGSVSITTTGFPNATLTKTGTLPAGILFTPAANGSASLHGAAAAKTAGTYTITLTAANSVSSVNQVFTLTVNQLPAITSLNHATLSAGAFGTFGVVTTGIPTDAISEIGTLPAGITLVDGGNGHATLGGTAGVATGGKYVITVDAANTAGTTAQVFTLTVNQTPVITSDVSATFITKQTSTFFITATGFPNPTITERGLLPAGVFFGLRNGTAAFFGTPGPTSGKDYPFTLLANNGIGTNTMQFTLHVDQPAAIASLPAATFTVGKAGSFTIKTSGFPAVVSISDSNGVADLAAGLTFTDNGNGTATIAGTPTALSGGAHTLTFSPNNNFGNPAPIPQPFVLTIKEAPQLATSNASPFTLTVGTAATVNINTTGFPAPTFLETGLLPAGIKFTQHNGVATLAGTPLVGSGRTYAVTLTALNGIGLAAKQTYTLAVDEASITTLNHATFTVGKASTFTIKTSSFPIHPALSAAGLGGLGLSFTDLGNGTATLSGAAAAATGGMHLLTFTADNGVSPAGVQVFTLTIDQPPAFTGATSAVFTTGAASTFAISTTGFPNATITESGLLPLHVTLVNNHDGTASLAGTPPVGAGRTYTVHLTASNGIVPLATETYTLTVDQPAAFSSAAKATFIAARPATFKITTTGFPAAALTCADLPTDLTLTDNHNGTGSLIGALAKNTYTFTLTASNGIGSAINQVFTLIVN